MAALAIRSPLTARRKRMRPSGRAASQHSEKPSRSHPGSVPFIGFVGGGQTYMPASKSQ